MLLLAYVYIYIYILALTRVHIHAHSKDNLGVGANAAQYDRPARLVPVLSQFGLPVCYNFGCQLDSEAMLRHVSYCLLGVQ